MKIAKKRLDIGIEKYVALFMLIIGFVMMNLVPTWQTPDERTHLNMIGFEIGKDDTFSDKIYNDIDLEAGRILQNFDEKVDIDLLSKAMTEKPDYTRREMLPEGVRLTIVRHLPATIGILTGIIIGLPSYWVLILGELFALIFYVTVSFKALKLMPLKKEVFASIMLMPMALHQAGSLNYDAVVLPLIFLLIGYVFKLKYQEKIELIDFVKLASLCLIISYIKMPYVVLAFLVFVLPIDNIYVRFGKYEIDGKVLRKIRIPFCIIGGILFGIAVYFLRDVFYIEMILSLITEWKRSLYLFYQTGVAHTRAMIISTVGNFGWLDTPIRYDFAIMVFVVIAAFAIVNSDENSEVRLKTWDRIVIWGVAIVACLFTTAAMVNHTIMTILYGSEWAEGTYDIRTALYQIPYIGGIQGRYFLPFVSLFFIPLPQVKRVNKKLIWSMVALFEVVMFIYIIHKLLERYWLA